MDWLKKIAPTAATLLGGPLAGLAVELLGPALGLKDATVQSVKDSLTAGNLSGDQLAAIKQAELALVARCKELDIDLEKVHASDRDSARRREMEVKDYVPGILAGIITVGFFGVLGFMLSNSLPETGRDALLVMLGALGGAWGSVVAYYFGSSSGSNSKNALIEKLTSK
jgi:hypothetical protein